MVFGVQSCSLFRGFYKPHPPRTTQELVGPSIAPVHSESIEPRKKNMVGCHLEDHPI